MKEETILKNEWCKQFGLTAVTPTKFYKIIGCFAVGFEMEKLYGKIQPLFVLYPLWRNGIKECFSWPYMYQVIKDSKGFQYNLSSDKILNSINVIFHDCNELLKVDIKNNFHLKDVIELINSYYHYNEYYINNPQREGVLLMLKIHIAVYLNDKTLFDKTVSEMDVKYAKLTEGEKGLLRQQSFEYYFGKYEDWKNNLISTFSKRQEILNKIEDNIANCKIKERLELLP